MQTSIPIPILQRQKYAEGSKLAPFRDDRNTMQAWKKNEVVSRQVQAQLDGLQQMITKMGRQRRRILGAGFPPTWVWKQPYKEIDPALPVAQDTWVYISPNNTIVTTGLVDVVSGLTVKSCEGFWQAAKNVPRATSDGKYNVPVFPYPGATGTPTGSPGIVQGDLDSDTIFWYYLGQVAC